MRFVEMALRYVLACALQYGGVTRSFIRQQSTRAFVTLNSRRLLINVLLHFKLFDSTVRQVYRHQAFISMHVSIHSRSS
jgi:hypothetical protein